MFPITTILSCVSLIFVITVPKFGLGAEPFISEARANADAKQVCGSPEAMATFKQCVSKFNNFNNLVRSCGGSQFLIFSRPGTTQEVCSNAPEAINCIDTKYPLNNQADFQQALGFHEVCYFPDCMEHSKDFKVSPKYLIENAMREKDCIGAPIDMTRLNNFKASRQAHFEQKMTIPG